MDQIEIRAKFHITDESWMLSDKHNEQKLLTVTVIQTCLCLFIELSDKVKIHDCTDRRAPRGLSDVASRAQTCRPQPQQANVFVCVCV